MFTSPNSNEGGTLLIAIIIVAVTGVLAYGIQQTTARWEKDVRLPAWFSIAGNIFGIAMASCLGSLIGYMMWNWELGLICGAVGGWSSDWVVDMLASKFRGDRRNREDDKK